MSTRSKPVFGARPFGKRDAKLLLVALFNPYGIQTIPQSIEAWQSLSRHEVELLNLWPGRPGPLRLPPSLRLQDFDGIIIHPTVSYSPDTVSLIDTGMARGLADFDGVKVLMKQDEQVLSGKLPELVASKGFDIIFTCVPAEEQEKVYPRAAIGDAALVQVLTGYVTPSMRQGMPKLRRDIDVSYRGSIQQLEFGRLGYEKRGIGYDIAAALERHLEITHDISARWEDRIGGDAWDRFLARSAVVLGVESGANIFDYDGKVAAWCRAYGERHAGENPAGFDYYKRAHDEFLHTVEGNVNYAQISPRHFEAAAAGAAQLLYEGTYSGIFEPHRHFMPLKRDLSNFDEALDFIRDDKARAIMAERAYDEIILNERYWYASFIALADDAIDARFKAKGRARRTAMPRPGKPVAYLLTAQDPATDRRLRRFAASLSPGWNVTAAGIVDRHTADKPPLLEEKGGINWLRVDRDRHGAAWLPTAGHLHGKHAGTARALLATLAGYGSATDDVLKRRLGADISLTDEIDRFRDHCAGTVDTNAALIDAMERLGPPDLIVAADLDTLFAAIAIGEETGCRVVFDAREHTPYSATDFQHWEVDFWQSLEVQLCRLADLRIAATPGRAKRMATQSGVEFTSLPNALARRDGEVTGLEECFVRRARSNEPLKVYYQGELGPGRGLDDAISAWRHVKSGARLIIRGPRNRYRRSLMLLSWRLRLGRNAVSFADPPGEGELVNVAAEADVGLVPHNPAYFAFADCCPTAFSSYLAAGLPVLTSRTEFVAETVQRTGVGHIVDMTDPAQFARLVDELSADREKLAATGRKSRRLFEQEFNWEALAEDTVAQINSLAGAARSAGPDFSWTEKEAASRSAAPLTTASVYGSAAKDYRTRAMRHLRRLGQEFKRIHGPRK